MGCFTKGRIGLRPNGEQKTKSGTVKAMAKQTCTVSIRGLADPVEHAVRVDAESLYEAAVRGLVALREGVWSVQDATDTACVVVTVQPPAVEHRVRLADLTAWLEGGGRSPKDRIHRQRLKALLERKASD